MQTWQHESGFGNYAFATQETERSMLLVTALDLCQHNVHISSQGKPFKSLILVS